MENLTQSKLKELLHYDPLTGVFSWKQKKGSARIGQIAGKSWKPGYVRLQICGQRWSAHRLAFLYMQGTIPDIVDHINGVPSDNRWSNLRAATTKDNNRNCKMKCTNTSGVKGVRWAKKAKKWEARIRIEGKQITIGYFPDLIGAELALVRKRNEIHGEFARHR